MLESEDRLRAQALVLRDLVAETWPRAGDRELRRRVELLGEAIDTRFTVINEAGKVVVDSLEDAAAMDNHRDRPELLEARAREEGMAIRFSQTLQRQMMYVALPVLGDDGNVVGFVRAAESVDDIDARVAGLRNALLAGAALAIVPGAGADGGGRATRHRHPDRAGGCHRRARRW